MIGRLKGAVKSALMQKKIEEYYAGLDTQFVSYHDWICAHECEAAKEYKENGFSKASASVQMAGELSVRFVEYADCGSDFYEAFLGEQMFSSASAREIIVFANGKEHLAEYAIQVISDYFAANPECVLVYGDEDEWNSNRTLRMNPWFKPDFSPDTLLQYFYFGNVVAVRRSALEMVMWKRSSNYLMNLYDMCMQLSFPVKRNRIGHVQYVLYHAYSLQQLCTQEEYNGLRALYMDIAASKQGERRTLQNLSGIEAVNNKISIVIPSKDHPKVLEMCLDSLVNTVGNEEIEIIVVDNGSNENAKKQYEEQKIKHGFNYIFEPMEFNFSKMCNIGAKAATGKYLLFLNDDIETKESGWISKMRAHAAKSHVGVVGAKLYYPESKMIQHAGITNLLLGPVHKMQFMEDSRPFYDGRNQYDRNVLAVTAACLMVRKDVFEKCGGFLEDLAVAFNDVELCFRIYKAGFYNVQCNSAVLYHHESLSRGNDESEEKQVRLQSERSKMYRKHPDLYGNDPFYHPYLNQQILDTNFSFAYEYPAGESLDICEPVLLKGEIKQEWYNECLLVSMEYAGELSAWLEGPDRLGNELYFQGYQFVIGSDNACFERYILLKNVDKGEIYQISCGKTFRPDLAQNVTEGNVSLCGFACIIEKGKLPVGRYQVGCMAVSLVDRLKLCRFINKFVEV